MLKGASFGESSRVKMAPAEQRHSSLFEAELHKEWPAEWNSSCCTKTHMHTDTHRCYIETYHGKCKGKQDCGGQGVPLAMCKADQPYLDRIYKHLPADYLL